MTAELPMSSKRKSPPIKIASEDFLFPTKRIAFDNDDMMELETERSNMSDDASSDHSETLKESIPRPIFNNHPQDLRYCSILNRNIKLTIKLSILFQERAYKN